MRPTRTAFLLMSFLLVSSAHAVKTVWTDKAYTGTPVQFATRQKCDRLRVEHLGGLVVIEGHDLDTYDFVVTNAQNLPPKSGGLLSRTPSISVLLEQVSPGNWVLRTTGPDGKAPAASGGATPPPFMSIGGNVRMSGNISIGGGGVELGEGVIFGEGVEIGDLTEVTPSKAPTATLRVLVPRTALKHVSVTSGAGNVDFLNLEFPEPTEGTSPSSIVHGKTASGKVTLTRVRHGLFLSPTRGFSTKEGCSVRVLTAGHEALLEEAFR